MDTSVSSIQVVPSAQGIGADIIGIDLGAQISQNQVDTIKAAWYKHSVLRFRGQDLNDDSLVTFTKTLGTIDKAPPRSNSKRIPGAAGDHVLIISNVKENGESIGELGDGEAFWHQDMTYMENPPVGAFLYAVELPPEGGNTEFCDLIHAYESLPQPLQNRVNELTCIHDITLDSSGQPRKGHTVTVDPTQAKGPTHPLVKTHPRSGRKHLYLGRRPNAFIPELTLQESEELLDTLWTHCNESAMRWTQVWQPGDLILWDNRSTLHRRDKFGPEYRRILHRTQLADDMA